MLAERPQLARNGSTRAGMAFRLLMGLIVGCVVMDCGVMAIIAWLGPPRESQLLPLLCLLPLGLAAAWYWPESRFPATWNRWSAVAALAVPAVIVAIGSGCFYFFVAFIAAFDRGTY